MGKKISFHPDDVMSVESLTQWPLSERHRRCLERYTAVATCLNGHVSPSAVPCRDAWCPRCCPTVLHQLFKVYSLIDSAHIEHDRNEVLEAVGSTATIMTISRTLGTPKAITREPDCIDSSRRSLSKVVERLAAREKPLMRADRLRLDDSGVWHVDRLILLQDQPNIGRVKSAAITASGETRSTVHQFLALTGANWTSVPLDKALARVFVERLKGAHRVESFDGFGSLLRKSDSEVECSECGGGVKVEFVPLFAAPTIPTTTIEFLDAVVRMRRGPPLIKRRKAVRAA